METVLCRLIRTLEKHGEPLRITERKQVQVLAPPKQKMLSYEQRMIRHRRRCTKGQQVYGVVDRLRVNQIIYDHVLEKQLQRIKQEIQLAERLIVLRETSSFQQLRQKQFKLCTRIYGIAHKRAALYCDISYHKASILSLLNTETILVDQLVSLDTEVIKMCVDAKVWPINEYSEAEKIVVKIWGPLTRTLFSEIGKI